MAHAGAQDPPASGDPATPEFWAALCPALSVSAGRPAERGDSEGGAPTFGVAEGAERTLQSRLDRDGYFTVVPPSWALHLAQLDALADAVLRLKQAGWPSTFLVVFDLVWQLQRDLVAPLMRSTTGNTPNSDMLALLVDPAEGAAGFTPHRDRQPDDVKASFRPDGSPKYSTAWLALRDATPENGCLYFIPRGADPGYYDGDGDGPDDDMLRDALSSKLRYQQIRSVPLPQGGAAFFSHRLIHWGSQGVDYAPTPRIALSFAFSDPAWEEPYLQGADAEAPDFNLRLALAAGQMLVYHERFEPTAAQLKVYMSLFKRASERFAESYRRKVNLHFVAAVKDVERRAAVDPAVAGASVVGGAAAAASGAAENDGSANDDNTAAAAADADADADDAIDEAMDAMLDAVNDGYGDGFVDDFDDAVASDDAGGGFGEGDGTADDVDKEEGDSQERPAKKPRSG